MYRSKNTIRKNPEPFKYLFNTNTKAWKYYYDLIRTLYYNERFEGCHCHHIMPRCVFDWGMLDNLFPNNAAMRDSPYNTCYVTLEEHTVLHYCLYLCAKDEQLKKAMNWAWSELAKQSKLTRQELKRIVYGKIQ